MLRFLGFAERLPLGLAPRTLFFPLASSFFSEALALGIPLGPQTLPLDLLLCLLPIAVRFLLDPLRLALGFAFFFQAHLLGLARTPLRVFLFLLFRQLPLSLCDPLCRLTVLLFLLAGDFAQPGGFPLVLEPRLVPCPLCHHGGFRLGQFSTLLLFGACRLLLLLLFGPQSLRALGFLLAQGLLALLLLQALELGAFLLALLLLAFLLALSLEALFLALGLLPLLLFVALSLEALFLAVLLVALNLDVLFAYGLLARRGLLLCQLCGLAGARLRRRRGALGPTSRRWLRSPGRIADARRTFFSRC